MKFELEIPDYNKHQGLRLIWEEGFRIDVKQQDIGSIVIKANEAGLLSLARHFITLSNSSVPNGYHIHFDDMNSLEDGSCELIIEKGTE